MFWKQVSSNSGLLASVIIDTDAFSETGRLGEEITFC